MPLSEILVAANVPPQQVDQLVNDGWTSEHFALCATSLEEFDNVMAEIFDASLTPLHRAALRLAWTRCQPQSATPQAEAPTTSGYQDVSSTSTSWSETFAPKLTSALVSDLKVRFKRNYPAEVLLPENNPSLRLLSMVAHQKQKQDYRWIPWKYRLTESKCDEITAARPSKVAKAEGLQLHSILMDEPPAMEIANGNMGMHALRQMFETFSFAMAMTETAHLSSLKGYYLKFLNMMTHKFDADTGLRGPTILEAQAADKALMTTVIELVVERTWSWDDALYEITHIRADMTSLLQPRPRLPKAVTQARSDSSTGKGGSHFSRPAPYSKGSGKQGKSKSKSSRVQWITEMVVKGEKKQLCMRFQSGKCNLGRPDLSGPQLLRVQESNLMLERCIVCLRLVISSGGHSHLEQPPSAMSWQEPAVQQYISQESCLCISVAACGYGRDWHKSWMLASTFRALGALACQCSHPYGSHQQIAGALSSSGHYLSRDTAEYPEQLATSFAQLVCPLLTTNSLDLDLSQAVQFLPIKLVRDPPFSRQDGGGFASQADWSASHSFEDCFQVLRKNFFHQIMQNRLDQVLLRAFSERQDKPPFEMEQLIPFRRFLDEFLLAQGLTPDWTVPPDQQLCLYILQQLCQCMQDPDTSLFPYLITGVPLGIHDAIEPSKCFPLNSTDSPFDHPMTSVHHVNWQSAEDDPATVQELIDKEVASGWVSVFSGSLEEAQEQFPDGFAMGKLGLALSETRPPRLVLDSSICGVNQQSQIPEKSTLPTARDVVRSYPLRGTRHQLSGVSFDVKSAHKQVAINPRYRGYFFFQFNGVLYYYRNCPFGATISAHFWSRLGGAYQRLFHRLCFLPHASFLYVDDLLWLQETSVIGLSAAVIAIICLLTGLPISWKSFVAIPTAKREKLLSLLQKLRSSTHCSKKSLERFLGLALWVTQLWPEMRIWLHYLYRDLHSIPASQFSVDPGNWEEILNSVSEDLIFFRKPRFTAIPLDGHLVQVRHQAVHSKSDLQQCALSDKRIFGSGSGIPIPPSENYPNLHSECSICTKDGWGMSLLYVRCGLNRPGRAFALLMPMRQDPNVALEGPFSFLLAPVLGSVFR
eukprot:s698_g21.t1